MNKPQCSSHTHGKYIHFRVLNISDRKKMMLVSSCDKTIELDLSNDMSIFFLICSKMYVLTMFGKNIEAYSIFIQLKLCRLIMRVSFFHDQILFPFSTFSLSHRHTNSSRRTVYYIFMFRLRFKYYYYSP